MTQEAQLAFAIKFKKTMEGSPLSDEICTCFIEGATATINEMYEEAKIVRSLTLADKKPVAA